MKDSKNLSDKCNLCNSHGDLSSVVVSRGNPHSKLMIIGEAPGAMENKLGEPFVGRSGKLLDNLLNESGINSYDEVYLCNVIKCRPPNNRRPTKLEIQVNMPWLNQQILLLDPYIILLLGATALDSVLGVKESISTLRGTWQNWGRRLVMPLFHPSYLLRNPSRDANSPLSLTLLDLTRVRRKLFSLKVLSEKASSKKIISR